MTPDAPTKKEEQIRPPRWFRRWFWFWLFLMSLIALAGYAMFVHSGEWTPDHLIKAIMPGM